MSALPPKADICQRERSCSPSLIQQQLTRLDLQGLRECARLRHRDRHRGAHSHYWLRAKPGAGGRIVYKNEIPWEIVRIFEAHGFIGGGKWYYYDTMHFEYRPELIGAAK
jgi:D-alanyl-D-alanine carboxypeptidase